MAEEDELLSAKEKQNFSSVQQSLGVVAKYLHHYVDKELKEFHHKISSQCMKFETCKRECSQPGIGTFSWCDTCNEWRKYLSESIRYRGMKVFWDKMHSWEWPDNYLEIGKVYCQPNICQNWQTQSVNDLPMYLGIIERCSIFPTSKTFSEKIKKIRDVRNNIAHKQSQQLSDIERDNNFNMLEDFLSADEIATKVNSQALLKELQDIKDRKEFEATRKILPMIHITEQQTWICNIESRVQNIEKLTEPLKQTKKSLSQDSENVTGEHLINCQNQDTSSKVGISDSVNPNRNYKWPIMSALFIILRLFVNKSGIESDIGCLTEEISSPLLPDIYLFNYIKEHTKITGREWLLQNISDTVFDKKFDSTGLLLVAEMGFGKSALVSHIVCAETTEPGGKLRRRLLAYHVCRFNAKDTKNAAIFIRRLAGMISNTIPEFASALETSYAAVSHLNLIKCNYDPVGCMVQSIVHTLSKVEPSIDTGRIWIIVIDALDECEDADAEQNEITSVLEQTVQIFPKWVKFICTSRNIPTIARRLGHFRRMEITSSDDRNKRDICDFISKSVNANLSTFQTQSSTFTLDNKTDIVDRLCEMSSGNFLYIRHVLEHFKSTNVLRVENIPNTLDTQYQFDFERIYGKKEQRFELARKVLEILCASTEPMKQESIFDILRFDSTNISTTTFSKEMHTLMHFVRSDELVSFTHISMYHWLTDVKRVGMTYFIEKEVGHNLMARYLFHLIKDSNNNNDNNIINLAFHVSESKRQYLISEFKSLELTLFNRNNGSSSLLHILAKRLNSYLAIKLCLYHIKEVDILNDDNLTAAFIAAGRGHKETLRALLDAGANITFLISLPILLATVDDAALITKTRTFWGYGLLDIAAQHGHLDTIRLLLDRNKNMANVVNDMNVMPHHLACEFGHAKVLEIFLKLSPRFADQMCLYKAASNGHTHIIKRLLNLGVTDLCLPCNGSFYWFKECENRMQSPFLNPNSSDKSNLEYVNKQILKRKPFDDWWTVSCETALHVSSRLGFTDIVRVLISREQNSIKCRDRAGRTPFLTAVIHNRTDIVELLYPLINASDKCLEWNLTQEEVMHLNGREISKLSEGKCSNSSSVIHLIARYGLTNLANHDLFRDMDWEEEDMEGCRPIHHAACHAGLDMLKYLHGRKVDFFSRTKNGSTAFHIAALCRPFNLHFMCHLNSETLPPLFDHLNRSILQYMYMYTLSTDSRHALNSISNRIDLMERLFSEEDMMHVDSTGANILHYIMKHGYFNAIPYLNNKYQDIFFKRILKKNNLKHIPLDEAFYNLPYDARIVRTPYNCSMNEVIALTCGGVDLKDYVMYMSPIELTIFFFVTTVSSKIEYHRYFKHYVHEAIKRSNVYVTLMFLIYFNAHSTLGKDGFNPLTTFTSIGNNPFMANLFLGFGCDCLKCGVPIEQSPLHHMSLNMKNSFWFVDSMRVHAMLKDLNVEYIEKCVDTEGFNVLHRAIQGGNHELVKYYVERGLSISKEYILRHVILGAMAKFSMPILTKQPYTLQLFNRTKYLYDHFTIPVLKTDYDVATLLVLRHLHHGNMLTYNHICRTSKATLSLVHFAAANGLLKSLEYIADQWGKKALLCQNAGLLSPIYLAYVYNQSQVIQYLEKQNITLVFPNLKHELNLAYIILFNADRLHQRKRHFLRSFLRCVNIINYSPHNYFVFVRGSRCLKVISCSELLPESAYQLKNAQQALAFHVRKVLDILSLNKIANNICKTLTSGQCSLDYSHHIRPATSKMQFVLKNIISIVFQLEIHNPKPTLYAMKWLFNRYDNIRQRFNSTKHQEYFEIVSSLIEPALGKKYLYLRKLTLIGRYKELRTINKMVQNIPAQFSFELPIMKKNYFKSLYHYSVPSNIML